MEQRLCQKCNEYKLLNQFAWRNHSKGTYQPYCRACTKIRDKSRNLHARYKEQNRINRKIRKAQLRIFLRKLKLFLGCKICGYKRCSRALELHHLYDNKDKCISHLAQSGTSISRLKKELRKCVILCSNCHREIHENLTAI
jgi:hypothetical protein